MPKVTDEEAAEIQANVERANSPNSRQVAGDHYLKYGDLQHWDVVAHFGLDYFAGQVTKYIFRWRDKNGIQDLEKALHYLEKYIAVEKAKLKDNGASNVAE